VGLNIALTSHSPVVELGQGCSGLNQNRMAYLFAPQTVYPWPMPGTRVLGS